ncbi:Hypothetical predicted protein [Paramuricea clavata]|uniref:Uncharacterized protein n=1 Tax=Paramuricea clavata TaxID=317549 RepID=A0A6S7IBM1_PARCT|nr:Hypothetical predicted protein [Paramuricea clavata]
MAENRDSIPEFFEVALSDFNVAAHARKKFEKQIKEKRNKNKAKAEKGSNIGRIVEREELTVQRLSYDEVTLQNIKLACEKHILAMVVKGVARDMLAGEQEPSCFTLEQIPDLKLIHIRFIHRSEHDEQGHAAMSVSSDRDDS